MLGAEGCQKVVLRVVEIGLKIQTRIALLVRDVGCTKVYTEPLLSKLDEDTLRQSRGKGQGLNEIGKNIVYAVC